MSPHGRKSGSSSSSSSGGVVVTGPGSTTSNAAASPKAQVSLAGSRTRRLSSSLSRNSVAAIGHSSPKARSSNSGNSATASASARSSTSDSSSPSATTAATACFDAPSSGSRFTLLLPWANAKAAPGRTWRRLSASGAASPAGTHTDADGTRRPRESGNKASPLAAATSGFASGSHAIVAESVATNTTTTLQTDPADEALVEQNPQGTESAENKAPLQRPARQASLRLERRRSFPGHGGSRAVTGGDWDAERSERTCHGVLFFGDSLAQASSVPSGGRGGSCGPRSSDNREEPSVEAASGSPLPWSPVTVWRDDGVSGIEEEEEDEAEDQEEDKGEDEEEGEDRGEGEAEMEEEDEEGMRIVPLAKEASLMAVHDAGTGARTSSWRSVLGESSGRWMARSRAWVTQDNSFVLFEHSPSASPFSPTATNSAAANTAAAGSTSSSSPAAFAMSTTNVNSPAAFTTPSATEGDDSSSEQARTKAVVAENVYGSSSSGSGTGSSSSGSGAGSSSGGKRSKGAWWWGYGWSLAPSSSQQLPPPSQAGSSAAVIDAGLAAAALETDVNGNGVGEGDGEGDGEDAALPVLLQSLPVGVAEASGIETEQGESAPEQVRVAADGATGNIYGAAEFYGDSVPYGAATGSTGDDSGPEEGLEVPQTESLNDSGTGESYETTDQRAEVLRDQRAENMVSSIATAADDDSNAVDTREISRSRSSSTTSTTGSGTRSGSRSGSRSSNSSVWDAMLMEPFSSLPRDASPVLLFTMQRRLSVVEPEEEGRHSVIASSLSPDPFQVFSRSTRRRTTYRGSTSSIGSIGSVGSAGSTPAAGDFSPVLPVLSGIAVSAAAYAVPDAAAAFSGLSGAADWSMGGTGGGGGGGWGVGLEGVVSRESGVQLSYEELLLLDEGVAQRGLCPRELWALERRTVTPADVHSQPDCQVCLCQPLVGDLLACLPCNHVFHNACITTWFARHRTCPLCRFEMPAIN